jgi:PAS domain S-box-containing protein
MLTAMQRTAPAWEELRAILDLLPAFVWYKDSENRILRANRAAAESMGLSVAEIEGRSTYELYPEDAAAYHRDDLEVIESGQPKLGIIEPLLVGSGEKRWIRTDKVPYRDATGQVVGVVVFSVDITERVDAERALRDARDGLEARIKERTQELAAALADLQNEMAERHRAEERISQHQAEVAHLQRLRTVESMTAQIAHEINQPLGAIANFASGLARWLRSDSPDIEYLVDIATRISQQAMRAAEVVRRLRDLVRKEDALRKPCDVRELVLEAVQMMASNARRRNVALRVAVAEDLPCVLVDRIQIEQVLLNLIANGLDAIAAVPPLDARAAGPNEVIIEADRRDGRYIEIRVHDTGTGIPGTHADHMFDPFFSTKAEGLGMGLAISRTIVEAHGGDLRAVAGDGRGATFVFNLPVAPDS